MAPAVEVRGVSHRYGDRLALHELNLTIEPRQLYAVLGPNGGGKTTLFRLLSTLVPLQSGQASLMGYDLASQSDRVRRQLGVVFQHPSLDKKLTVAENLAQHAALYGLGTRELRARQPELLAQLGLSDRVGERVERLSGGLQRRVEIAKSLLHHPQLLLMDEPTTGLDPAVRTDLWQYLGQLRQQRDLTIVMTTHLLEEAERVDRLAILDQGRLVAEGTPRELSQQVGGQSVRLRCDDPQRMAAEVAERLGVEPRVAAGLISWDTDRGAEQVDRLLREWGPQIREVAVGQATLEDVFLKRTGHQFWGDADGRDR
ncbi:MAG: ABC transporter ATP-binding protein [Pirellulales bacterium]